MRLKIYSLHAHHASSNHSYLFSLFQFFFFVPFFPFPFVCVYFSFPVQSLPPLIISLSGLKPQFPQHCLFWRTTLSPDVKVFAQIHLKHLPHLLCMSSSIRSVLFFLSIHCSTDKASRFRKLTREQCFCVQRC